MRLNFDYYAYEFDEWKFSNSYNISYSKASNINVKKENCPKIGCSPFSL